MATALATSIVITVVLLLLVILAMTGKRLGTNRATAALVGVGYGLLLLVSITGAGVDLPRVPRALPRESQKTQIRRKGGRRTGRTHGGESQAL